MSSRITTCHSEKSSYAGFIIDTQVLQNSHLIQRILRDCCRLASSWFLMLWAGSILTAPCDFIPTSFLSNLQTSHPRTLSYTQLMLGDSSTTYLTNHKRKWCFPSSLLQLLSSTPKTEHTHWNRRYLGSDPLFAWGLDLHCQRWCLAADTCLPLISNYLPVSPGE